VSQGSTTLPTTGVFSGLVEQQDINAALAALLSNNSGASAPSAPTDGMLWRNTTTSWVQIYDASNSAWHNLFYLDETNALAYAQIGGGAETTIASAATTDLWSVPSNLVEITGTTNITALCASDATQGTLKLVTFAGALTLTNGTNLLLPNGGSNITTAAGDWMMALGLGSRVQVVIYTRANGQAIATNTVTSTSSSSTANDIAIESGTGGTQIADSGVAISKVTNAAQLNVPDQTLAGGANVTSYSLGTQSSGTLTVDCGKGPLQYLTNGGAFTLNPPANDGSCMILVTNNSSAGAITFGSGFTVGADTGPAPTTTNTSMFTISVWRINGVSGYSVFAHQ
jgi:hypothetical protein